MTTATCLTLLGLSVGVLIIAAGKPIPPPLTTAERAILAQKLAAEAARVARELTARAAKES